MSQRVIVLRGTPASGKTTIARSYRNFDEKVAWLKVDNFKDFFAEDSSIALEYVNGSAIATLTYLLESGFSVVMDGVFQDTDAIQKAVEVCNKLQIVVKVFELEVSLETLKKRDLERDGVPQGLREPLGDEKIEQIYTKLKNNPYSEAITLNTEENNLEKCKEIIDELFH
jgi:predicted kinase